MAYFPSLPQVQQFDVSQPVRNYLAGKDRQRQIATEEGRYQNELARTQQRDKLEKDEFANTLAQQDIENTRADKKAISDEEASSFERTQEKLKMNENYQAKGKELLEKMNPDAPNFPQQKAQAVDMLASMLNESGQFSGEEIRTFQKVLMLTHTPDTIREAQRKLNQGSLAQGTQYNPNTGRVEVIPGADTAQQALRDPEEGKVVEGTDAQGNPTMYRVVGGVATPVTGMNPKLATGMEITTGPDGTTVRTNVSGKDKKPPTEFQGKSATFSERMDISNNIISNVGSDGEVQPGLIKRGAEAIPLIGDALGTATNWTQSEAQQQVSQAQRDFVNAVLRQESGAAIADSEFASATQQYFPQPGDGPKVIQQKKQNRETAIRTMKAAAGPATENVMYDGNKLLIGSVYDGYIYVGGNEGDKKSWKKVK